MTRLLVHWLKRFSFASLRVQFVIILLILGTLAIGLSSIAIVREQILASHEHSERELRTISILAQGSFTRAMRYELDEAVDELLAELAAHRRVRGVALLQFDDSEVKQTQIVGSQRLEGYLSAFLEAESWRDYQSNETVNIFYLGSESSYVSFIPVHSRGQRLGIPARHIVVIDYLHPLTVADAFASRLFNISVASSILLFIFLLLFWYWRAWVAKPSRTLIDAIQRAEAGGELYFEDTIRTQELRQFAQSLSAMVNQRKENEEQLRKLSAAVEQSHEGILITDQQGTIEYVNDALIQGTGYSREELVGNNPNVLASGQTPRNTFKELWEALNKGESWTGEFYNRRKDGSEYIELQTITPLRNGAGEITHYLGIKQDITEQKSIQERLHFLAYFDTLTHLPNRTSVLETLKHELEEAGKKEQWGALVLVNIDRMKDINDARGFAYGNDVLLALTERLTSQAGSRDFIGHLGADSFCIVLPARYRDEMQAIHVVEDYVRNLMEQCHEPFSIRDESVQLTVSAGISLIGHFDTNAEVVIQSAETALHNAKRQGGNQHSVYQDKDGEEVERIFRVESELRQALDTDQLKLYLQAQMNERGELQGAEALVRWQHPTQGMLSPAEFIPVAERSDLIAELDKWVLRKALQVVRSWEESGQSLTMSVNISPRHIRREQFVDNIRGAIAEAAVRPSSLVLEVTEGLLVENVNESIAKMQALTADGVQFAIDDFGTGYSSLSYVRNLPIHELKIDQSFIRGVPDTKGDVVMVKTIVSFAQNLGLRVVAEGVETRAQSNFCKSMGICAQGYFYERPTEVHVWQRKWRNPPVNE